MADATSRNEAQARVDRLRVFLEQLDSLEREGVLRLSPEQRARVAAHHQTTIAELAVRFDVDTTDSERQLSWGMRIASTLGAVALCIAVVLFAARFLGYLPAWAQVLLLAATPLALLAGAEFAARRERTLYFTGLLALIAFAAFIVNLEMAGMIFSFTPTRNALLAFAAFALGVAYHYRLRLLLAAGLVCLLGFAEGKMIPPHWEEGSGERILLAGVCVAMVPLLAGRFLRRPAEFPPVYRIIGAAAMFVAIAAMALGAGSAVLSSWQHDDVRLVYQHVGLVMAAAAIWLGIVRGWTETVDIGSLFFVAFLLVRLGEWLWDDIPKYLFFLLVGAIGIALLLVFRRIRGRMARTVEAAS